MRRYPRFASPTSGLEVWLAALEAIQSFDVDVLVPSHGPLGDASTIGQYKLYFTTIQTRVTELLSRGKSADEIVEKIGAELGPALSDWKEDGARFINIAVRRAIEEEMRTVPHD